MKWDRLLSTTRTRTLFEREPSLRSPDDPRTEFERDYGRTIFSTPVRRLQDKAQVYPLVTHDYVRTRLTHSIEVSSVARGLGATAAAWLEKKGELDTQSRAAVEVIAATCGILHDLGNPPFGHAGEDAISEWCSDKIKSESLFSSDKQRAGDFSKWNGNAQTIRLVGKLQVLSDEFGLNLTAATLSAACKYIAPSHEINKDEHDKSKTGYFFSENELIRRVREATGTGDARHPITHLVEASDDIVYSSVDLEDGIKKRLITWEQLESELLSEKNKCTHTEKAIMAAKKKIGNSMRGASRDDALVQAFRTYAIIEATVSTTEEFQKNYQDIIEGRYHSELVKKCSARQLVKACKDIAREVVYRSSEVLRVELMGRKIIKDLLSVFWEGAQRYPNWKENPFAEKPFLLTSSNYRQVFLDSLSRISPDDKDSDMYARLQLVCDYIAGMTDTFATNLHKELTNA